MRDPRIPCRAIHLVELTRMLRRVLLVVLVAVAALAAYLQMKPSPAPRVANRGENAIWMAHRWFGSTPTESDIRAMSSKLVRNGIRDVYFHAGPLDAKAGIPAWRPEVWRMTLQSFRRLVPGLRAHAWLGGVTVEWYGVAPDTIDLAKADVREKIASRAADLVKRGGFDGVHYDIEIVPDGHAGYPELLDLTRKRLPETLLSVAVLCSWSPPYLQDFARTCDHVDIMSYDLASRDRAGYVEYMAVLTERLCEQLQGSRCRFLMGIPSYDEKNGQHDPTIENVQTALLGVQTGIGRARADDAFQGVAIYAQWTTDDREWKHFEEGWPLPAAGKL